MVSDHIVKSFDDELNQLVSKIAEMGGLAERQLADSITALSRRDEELANSVIEQDARLDILEEDIDAHVIRMLALRQPQALDLRAVIVALKISAELERAGDYAKNVAKRALTLMQTPTVGPAANTIVRMGTIVGGMISNVIDAYLHADTIKAKEVRARDHDVDQIHTSLFRELLTYMMEDPRNITACTHLLFIAKNIERIGDHVTNIAENVHFLVSGENIAEDRPKSDFSSSTIVAVEDKAK
ncbi:MAG TPA: phosphate signaling complex protein PhoU [Alphaproteobacteria bacterium]|nr:phosphate transport system protein [Alphaproteobacteria bacterium]HEX4889561.1 phosphate signaling complex protein PhoU [Alphaproteobacteria bacterium]